jgi:NADPH:quinone reductase-like Zn-dependent oxidoreductase/acyl carrier protein
LPVVSNLTGAVAGGGDLTGPAYWRAHVRSPVRFATGMRALAGLGCDVFLELGPRPVLTGLGQGCLGPDGGVWLSSLKPGRPDQAQMIETAAELFRRGAPLDGRGVEKDRRILPPPDLPTTRFDRHRCWFEAAPETPAVSDARMHPLVDRITDSPLLPGVLAETAFSLAALPFLDDHRIGPSVVVPGACHLALLTDAIRLARGSTAVALEEVVFPQALSLSTEDRVAVQVLLPRGSGGFTLVSLDAEGAMRTHASGRVGAAGERPAVLDLEAIRRRCAETIDPQALYAGLDGAGIHLGARFRWITGGAARRGEALGRLTPPVAGIAGGMTLHPGLVDGCFQTLAAAGDADQLATFIPFALRRFDVFGGPGDAPCWCHAILREGGEDGRIIADISLADESGVVLVRFDSLEVRQVAASGLSGGVRLFYRVGWKALGPAPLPAAPLRLLIPEEQGVLARVLREAGHRVDARPESGAVYDLAVQDGLDASDPVSLVAGSVALVREVSALEPPPRLALVTRDAQAVTPGDGVANPAAAALWGVGRVIAHEHPGLRCRCLDIDGEALDDGAALAAVLTAADADGQVALRRGVRLGARLLRRGDPDPEPPALRVRVSTYGALDNLEFHPFIPPQPGPGELAVRMAATALNFRDVLHALGVLEAEARRIGITSPADLPFGFEGAGRVMAIGAGVEGFAVGQPVIVGNAPGSLDSVVIVPAGFAVPRPPQLTEAEAATLPVAALTALYGLDELARLQAGETILIHAAAGGVGQAAVQVALARGARVLATASPGKWPLLIAQGVAGVYHSREPGFGAAVRAATGGRGVDVVLNSLGDAVIQESLTALAPGGRFIEIGKREAWTEESMAEARPDIRYLPFDLRAVTTRDPGILTRLLRDAVVAAAKGGLRPLPLTAFPLEESAAAFRHLGQGRQIGKVVIDHPRGRDGRPLVRPGRSYLITGGFGALGLALAERLAERGAEGIALMGRHPPRESARERVAGLERRGVTVLCLAADIADEAAAEAAFRRIAAELPPLAGIAHAAGVLDDGLVASLTQERIAAVMAPKVIGARLLDRLSRGIDLDWFVLFSAAAGVWGAPGQGTYAAANAVLDSLAAQRRAEGRHALSIDWGPWAGSGMAAGMDAVQRERLAAQGFATLAPDRALDALESLLAVEDPQVSVMAIDFAALFERDPGLVSWPFLENFAASARQAATAATPGSGPVASMDRPALVTRIREEVARVIGSAAPDRIGLRQRLFDLGVDSLMAVELKNRLETLSGRPLRATLVFDHPTVEALADHLGAVLGFGDGAGIPPVTGVDVAGTGDLDGLSEDDLSRLLDEQMEDIDRLLGDAL